MCCINETTSPLSSGFVTTAISIPTRSDSVAFNPLQKRVRRVAFLKAEVVATLPPASEMSDSYRLELWYQQTDLSTFKNNARDLCRQIRECDDVPDQPLLDTRLDIALEQENDCARGLEHRISIERQKNKYLAILAILKAQQRYETPEQLAIVASKCTAWAKEVALFTGYQDFYQAYNPALAHLVPSTPSVKFPLLSRKKSADSSSDEEQSPKKRQRTVSPVPAVRTASTISAPILLL